MNDDKIRTGVPFPVTPNPECPEFDMCEFLHLSMSEEEREEQAVDISHRVENKLGGQPTVFKTETQILALKENIGVAVATDNGYYYTWDGARYVKRQPYQAAGIADDSITTNKIKDGNVNYTKVDGRIQNTIDIVEKETVFEKNEYNIIRDKDKFINASGIVASTNPDSNFFVSQTIEVKEKEHYFAISTQVKTNYLYALYDEAMNFVSGYQCLIPYEYSNYKDDFFIPKGVKYLIFGGYETKRLIDEKPKLYKLENPILKATPKKDSVDYITFNKIMKDSVQVDAFEELLNVVTFPESLKGNYINSNGEIIPIPKLPDLYRVSDYIDASLFNGIFVYTGKGLSAGYPIGFYDETKKPIGVYPPTGSNDMVFTEKEVRIPQKAKYLVFGKYASFDVRVYNATKYTFQNPDTLPQVPKWKGKKWTGMGDSLTEVNFRTTKHYFDFIVDETGIEFVNLGKSGTSYARDFGSDVAFYKRVNEIPLDTDILTIFGSGNDMNAGLPLGEISDVNTTTICGCINTTINNIYDRLPTIQLGIISPTAWLNQMPTDENGNCWMQQYSTKLKEICESRCIPFLDLYHNSNLRPNDAKFRELCYSEDGGNGTHPNALGHQIIAPRFQAFLDSLLIH